LRGVEGQKFERKDAKGAKDTKGEAMLPLDELEGSDAGSNWPIFISNAFPCVLCPFASFAFQALFAFPGS
jgi:hypothetical protein